VAPAQNGLTFACEDWGDRAQKGGHTGKRPNWTGGLLDLGNNRSPKTVVGQKKKSNGWDTQKKQQLQPNP